MYCCTIDLVSRKLPENHDVKYPLARATLLRLMSQDQNDRNTAEFSFDPTNPDLELVDKLLQRDTDRSRKVSEILGQINDPSTKNIGLDGSRAVWIIAMHSASTDFQKSVLEKMNRLYALDKSQVFYPGIPYLEDRYMVNSSSSLEEATQLYGTQGYLDPKTGGLKVFKIIKPKDLAKRRKEFDLNPDPNARKCSHSNAEK